MEHPSKKGGDIPPRNPPNCRAAAGAGGCRLAPCRGPKKGGAAASLPPGTSRWWRPGQGTGGDGEDPRGGVEPAAYKRGAGDLGQRKEDQGSFLGSQKDPQRGKGKFKGKNPGALFLERKKKRTPTIKYNSFFLRKKGRLEEKNPQSRRKVGLAFGGNPLGFGSGRGGKGKCPRSGPHVGI